MMCYRDRTYCTFYETCKDGDGCDRALTPEVVSDAKKWWGNDNAPIAYYGDKPECHKDKRWTP